MKRKLVLLIVLIAITCVVITNAILAPSTVIAQTTKYVVGGKVEFLTPTPDTIATVSIISALLISIATALILAKSSKR